MTTYGDGIGRVYQPTVQSDDNSNDVRIERDIVTSIDGERVTVTMRNKIVAFDPYLNLVRAAIYARAKRNEGGMVPFPVPLVNRKIVDALIRISGEEEF